MENRTRNVTTAVGLVFFGLFAIGSGKSNGSSGATTSAATSATAATTPDTPKTPVPEFVTKRQQVCDAYKSQTNEIKKSKTFTDYKASADAANNKLTDAAGTIEKIETSHGGGSLWLGIKTEFGTFKSTDLLDEKRQLKKGSPVYNAVGDMNVGDSVVFSATLIAPQENTFSEELSVCGDKWVALFTSVKKTK